MTNNDSLISCKDYLKIKSVDVKLTIIEKIELPKIKASLGKNFYFKSQFGSLAIYVRKGFIPIMKRDIDTQLVINNNVLSSNYPDYFCINGNMELNKTSQIFNLTQIKINYGSFTLKNVAIEIVVNNPNRTILSNYTIDHVYSVFGIFAFNIISSFGGNLFSPSRTFVNVQRIQTYPFKQIEINQFDLNCTLNELSLDCILRINISNYANSFQSISIDFDDGGINTTFILNSYCNLKKIKIILNRFKIKLNFFKKIYQAQ